ncbi:disks large-associated protein 5-like isoform X1 [Apis dorsata]|uniref:disks large-associated protein 5-like isoform X1 n=2 Tax=Apis dorsata TaxID=7462 RepID=UPI0003DF59AC|nr:disks large-associated protein 5-like isoform X1 [Apis dorsata]
MSSFRQQYKSIGTKTVSKGRLIRAEKHKDLRKVYRTNTFNENRNIPITTMNTQAEEDRINKLKKWKAERERQRKIEQQKKKRPFVVGIVHHKIYSPINNCNVPLTKTTKTCEPIPKRITRATEKRLMSKAIAKEVDKTSLKNLNKNQESQKKNKSFAPEGHKFRAPSGLLHIPLYGREVIQSMSPVRISQIMNTSSKTPRKSNKINISQSIKEDIPAIDTKLINTDIEEDSSIESISLRLSSDEKEKLNISYTISDSNDIKVMANNSMKEVTCSSENEVSPLKSLNSQCEPAFFSPHIVSSRGKSNARKEQQLRHGFNIDHSQNDDIPTKDNVMKNLNISVEEEERTAQYFQFLLNKEIDRLNELCEKWIKIKAEPETIEDGQYEINQAIGQTNLLISKKFERFRGLVADCETGKGEMLVTCKDLQGFWDMMYMEIKNCDLRFEKLEKLRSQGWKEEEIVIVKPIIKKKSTVKKKIVSTKSTSIRAILAEKKKNMTEKMKDNNSTNELESNLNHSNNCKSIENPNMHYEKKSISIDSKENKFTPVKHNKRSSLLQKVQLSNLSMKTKSPLTMIKISQMYKAPKIQLDDSISYINSNQTPGKGILKQQKNLNEIESNTKSINKVNFNDQMALNEISPNETRETKMNVSKVSAIDSFDLNNSDEIAIKVERKLLFDDTNFNDSLNDVKKDSENKNSISKSIDGTLPSNIETLTPLQEQKNVNKTSKKIIKQNAIDNENDVILNQTLTLDTNINSISSTEIIDDRDLNILNEKLEKNVCISNKEEINEHNGSIRVLRNRIVTSTDTPRAKRRSSKKMLINEQELEHKENETPLERRTRRSRVNINTGERRNIELVCYSCNDNEHLEKSNDKRKSTRSVKFSDKESNDGTNKSILPLTPHVRRSKNRNGRSTLLEDSISLEIEEKPPQRVRRSQNKKSSI